MVDEILDEIPGIVPLGMACVGRLLDHAPMHELALHGHSYNHTHRDSHSIEHTDLHDLLMFRYFVVGIAYVLQPTFSLLSSM